jgi:hypothetical protein
VLKLPSADEGTAQTIADARATALSLIVGDQKLLLLDHLPASSDSAVVDAGANQALPAYEQALPARVSQVWSSSKASDMTALYTKQNSARVTHGGLPQADDVRFDVATWNPISASDSDIVGSVDGTLIQHWIDPSAKFASIKVDEGGWQLSVPGALRRYEFHIVKESGGWRLATRYVLDPAEGSGADSPVDGGSPSGTAPSGTAPSGTAPSGTAPSGTAPSGTAPSGTAPADTAPADTR